jgi:hypothetical protein
MNAAPFRIIRARHTLGPTLFVRVRHVSAEGTPTCVHYVTDKADATIFPRRTATAEHLLNSLDSAFHTQPVTDLALRT